MFGGKVMIVHLNLGQMLAITELIHKMEWISNHATALKTGRHADMCQPVKAFTADGAEYKFYATGKVSVDGKNVEYIGVGLHFVPVIPKWWGDDMDDLWADMYVTEVMDWESEDFKTVKVVADVWRIIQGL
jgi:hypothetical protein